MPPAFDSPLARRVNVALLAVLMLVTLGVRVWFVTTQPAPPLVYDEAGYDASARRLLQTGTLAYPRYIFTPDGYLSDRAYAEFLKAPADAWNAPGYPAFLAAVYAVSGTGPQRLLAARLVQAVMSVLSLLVVWLLARRFSDRWVGIAGAVLLALYPPYTYATSNIMTETVYTFLLLASVLVTLVAIERRSWRWFLAVGVITMATATVRPVALLWPAFALLYMLFKPGYRLAGAVKYAVVMAAGVLLLLVPWWVRNYSVYHAFVPTTILSANPAVAATSARFEAGGRPQIDYPNELKHDDVAMSRYWAQLARQRIGERLRDRPLWLLKFRVKGTWSALRQSWPLDPPLALGHKLLQRLGGVWHALLWWLFAAGAVVALLRRDWTALLVASVTPYFLLVDATTMPLARYLQPAMAFNALAGAYGLVIVAWFAYARLVARKPGPLLEEQAPAEAVEHAG